MARAPAFWLDLVVPEPWWSRDEMGGDAHRDNGVPLPELTAMLARLVDSKSPFTHRHSVGVAVAAATGAALLGFDAEYPYGRAFARPGQAFGAGGGPQ